MSQMNLTANVIPLMNYDIIEYYLTDEDGHRGLFISFRHPDGTADDVFLPVHVLTVYFYALFSSRIRLKDSTVLLDHQGTSTMPLHRYIGRHLHDGHIKSILRKHYR